MPHPLYRIVTTTEHDGQYVYYVRGLSLIVCRMLIPGTEV